MTPKPKAKEPKTPKRNDEKFNMLAHDMYKRFGGVYSTLKQICDTPEKLDLMTTSLHVLRTEVRELLEKARSV